MLICCSIMCTYKFYIIFVGSTGGTITLLKKHPGLEHMADPGGCVLHHIPNAIRHAMKNTSFAAIEEFVDDVYWYFQRSNTNQIGFEDVSDMQCCTRCFNTLF